MLSLNLHQDRPGFGGFCTKFPKTSRATDVLSTTEQVREGRRGNYTFSKETRVSEMNDVRGIISGRAQHMPPELFILSKLGAGIGLRMNYAVAFFVDPKAFTSIPDGKRVLGVSESQVQAAVNKVFNSSDDGNKIVTKLGEIGRDGGCFYTMGSNPACYPGIPGDLQSYDPEMLLPVTCYNLLNVTPSNAAEFTASVVEALSEILGNKMVQAAAKKNYEEFGIQSDVTRLEIKFHVRAANMEHVPTNPQLVQLFGQVITPENKEDAMRMFNPPLSPAMKAIKSGDQNTADMLKAEYWGFRNTFPQRFQADIDRLGLEYVNEVTKAMSDDKPEIKQSQEQKDEGPIDVPPLPNTPPCQNKNSRRGHRGGRGRKRNNPF